ncbi:hypothetical protein [Duganella sp. Root336D2]|nr:hypothetical protein [Duganella sp. Root336D2]
MKAATSATLSNFSKNGTDVIRDKLMQSDPSLSIEDATALANRPKVQRAVQLFAGMGNVQDAAGVNFEDMSLKDQRAAIEPVLASTDRLVTSEVAAKRPIFMGGDTVEVYGRGGGFNDFVRSGANALDITQNAMADLIETVGPKKAQAAAFAMQIAVGGIPRTALSYLGDEIFGPTKNYLTDKLSDTIALRAFNVSDADSQRVEEINKVSHALSGFGVEAAIGSAGSLITGVIAYKYLRSGINHAPGHSTPDRMLPDNVHGNGGIEFEVKNKIPGWAEHAKSPDKRHHFDKIDMKSVTKEANTVIHPSMRQNVIDDMATIRKRLGDHDGDFVTVNGRTYSHHSGTVYPVSGEGFVTLDRVEFNAFKVYKTHGDTDLAAKIMANQERALLETEIAKGADMGRAMLIMEQNAAARAKALQVLQWGNTR